MGLFDGIIAPFDGVDFGSKYGDRVSVNDMWKYGNKTVYDFQKSDLINDNLEELRQTVATQASKQIDYQMLEQLKASLEAGMNPPEKTPEEKVIDIIKGGFEKKFGMTIQQFQEIYDDLVETSPEKLV